MKRGPLSRLQSLENTQWRLESRDTVIGTTAWQPLTNIALGPSPIVLEQPLTPTNRFYRGAGCREDIRAVPTAR